MPETVGWAMETKGAPDSKATINLKDEIANFELSEHKKVVSDCSSSLDF